MQCMLSVYLYSISGVNKCSLCKNGTFLTHYVYKGYTGVLCVLVQYYLFSFFFCAYLLQVSLFLFYSLLNKIYT